MKTRAAVALYVLALTVSMYLQMEFFYRVSSADSVYSIPFSDRIFFVLGSGILTFCTIVYILIRKVREGYGSKTLLQGRSLLVGVLGIDVVITLLQNVYAIRNDYFFSSMENVFLLGVYVVLLLLAIFVRHRVTYVVFMVIAVLYLLLLIHDIWSAANYSMFVFLGSGRLHNVGQVLAFFFFAYYAKKELTPSPVSMSPALSSN